MSHVSSLKQLGVAIGSGCARLRRRIRGQQLAAVPRRAGRRRGRRSVASGCLGALAEHRLEDRRAGPIVELAGRLGRSRLRDHGDQRRRGGNAVAGRGLRLTLQRRDDDASAISRSRRRRTAGCCTTSISRPGKIRWERAGGERRAVAAAAHEEQLCHGDAGDRRRARVCVLRVRRPVRVRHERQAAVVQADGAPQDARPTSAAPPRRCCTAIALYIVNDNDEQSFIAAFNAVTGAEVWRVNRKEATNWTSPFVWKNERRTEIVTAGSERVRSYDLDGKLLWELVGHVVVRGSQPVSRRTVCSTSPPGIQPISSGRRMRFGRARPATFR